MFLLAKKSSNPSSLSLPLSLSPPFLGVGVMLLFVRPSSAGESRFVCVLFGVLARLLRDIYKIMALNPITH